MKAIFFLIILLSGCKPQDAEQVELIQKFVKSIEDGKSIKDMRKEGILVKGVESEADSVYSMIIKSISDQILNCNNSNKKMEILDLEISKRQKQFNENIEVPNNGYVYILYCDNKIITRFLIKENRIASFSVINKGGRKVFLLL